MTVPRFLVGLSVAAFSVLLPVSTNAAEPPAAPPPPALKLTSQIHLRMERQTPDQNGKKAPPEELELSSVIHIADGRALLFESDADSPVTVVYDLKEKSWYEAATNRTVTHDEAVKWAKATRDRSNASLAKATDKEIIWVANAMLDPKLDASEKEGKLQLSGEIYSYVITPTDPLPAGWLEELQAFDRISAYQKAMQEMKWGPFSQLALNDELTRRKMWPREIELDVLMFDVKLQTKMTMETSKLTEAEVGEARKKLEEFSKAKTPARSLTG